MKQLHYILVLLALVCVGSVFAQKNATNQDTQVMVYDPATNTYRLVNLSTLIAQQDSVSTKPGGRRQYAPHAASFSLTGYDRDSLSTKCHRLSIGVRGGAGSFMQKADGFDALINGAAGVSVEYTHSWLKGSIQHGILTGLGITYTCGGLRGAVNDEWTDDSDVTYGTLRYVATAKQVQETIGQVQIEVPLMYSMTMDNGYFLHAGPKLLLPIAGHHTQELTDAHVTAYNLTYNPTAALVDKKYIGFIPESNRDITGKWSAMKVGLLLSLETGYEFRFADGSGLGLAGYVNYGLNQSLSTNDVSCIVVSPAVPEAKVLSATNTYAKSIGYIDFGVKVTYNIHWWK
ncbi:MAG: hypothetical protein KBS42_04505 [Bacteroidales bacterium]|nr:hypothetical protein [Candidatus Colicola coprequi]